VVAERRREAGDHARRLIGDPENDVLVSAVSLWEITDAHLIALAAPPLHHRDPFDPFDPFDHLVMAQAVAEGAHFVSQDRNVALYAFRS
jgi:PIN domain nuclease of toxin-antitoxin system